MDWMGGAARVAAIGLGATAVMDAWAWAQARLLGIPSLDYAMVGRWIGGLPRGRWGHRAIALAAPVRGEAAIGWAAHYAIGIGFAGMLTAVAGEAWLRAPTPGPPLLFGLASVAAPFLLLQPAMGAGLAASRTPRPMVARRRSVIAHLSFGLGLYLAAIAAAAIVPP